MSSSDDRDDSVVLGRIATRRMTGDELRAVKLADEKAQAAAPPPPKPAQLDVLPRLRLNSAKLAQVNALAQKRGVTGTEAAMILGYVSEDDVISAEAELTSGMWMSRAQLDAVVPLNALPDQLCLAMQVLPVSLSSKQLTVAMRDPLDRSVLQTLGEHTGGWRLIAVRAGATALQDAIARVTAKIDENDPESWIER